MAKVLLLMMILNYHALNKIGCKQSRRSAKQISKLIPEIW